MESFHGTTKFLAEIALKADATSTSPVIAHQDSLLETLEHKVWESRYVVAIDDAGSIVGLIASQQILARLNAANLRERLRWAATPLRSLINVVLTARSSFSITDLHAGVQCTAIAEGGRLVGLEIEGDIFLSWHGLEPMVSGSVADPLTGLMNRLAYERRLHEEWMRAERTGCSIGVIMIDLDHFKQINDQYGHLAGDEILKHVARAFEQSLRSYDLLARYGGDEFVAVCVGCRVGEIEIPVRRILQTLEATPAIWNEIEFRLSASIGAAVRHHDFSTSCPAGLFSAADECLYEAKRTRNTAFLVEFDRTTGGRPRAVDLSPTMPREHPGLPVVPEAAGRRPRA